MQNTYEIGVPIDSDKKKITIEEFFCIHIYIYIYMSNARNIKIGYQMI